MNLVFSSIKNYCHFFHLFNNKVQLRHFGKEVDVAVVCIYNQSHNSQMFFPCALKVSVPLCVCRCACMHGGEIVDL